MRYLDHSDIDKEKWDQCILASINGRPYGLSGWLDAVAPNWDAFIIGDYEGVFPIPIKMNWWRQTVFQPPFTQQLGLFFTKPENCDWLPQICLRLKSEFTKGYIQLNDANFHSDCTEFVIRKNYQLTYSEVGISGMSSSHQRSLKKAKKMGLELKAIDSEAFIPLYKKFNPVYRSQIWRHQKQLLALLKFLDNSEYGLGMTTTDQHDLQAGVWLAIFKNTAYHLMPFTTPTGRDNGAMHYLITHLRNRLPKIEIFDFEGSELPGVERFILGFGANLRPYPTLTW